MISLHFSAGNRSVSIRRGASLLVLLAFVVSACTVAIPPPGSAAERREIEQGAQYDEVIAAQFGVYDDAELSAYVDRIGQRVAAVSEWPTLPWTFRVLDSPVVNAFAVPGGYIYVTRGVLAHMNSEAELAGVLGHEVAHVTGRHSAEQQRRAALVGAGLALGGIVSPTFANYGLGSGLAQNALGLVLLRYSRGQELESDENGIRYAAHAGYDPRGIGDFFATLQALQDEGGGRGVPGWASTHPEVDDRIQRGEQWAAEALAGLGRPASELTVERRGHLMRVDNVVFGDDPRQGFFRDELFLHPELRFELRFPAEWRTVNTRQAVQAGPANQEALIQLTLATLQDNESREEYVRRLLGEIEATVVNSRDRQIAGNWAREVRFTVTSQTTAYEVFGTWIWYRERLYQLLGVTTPPRYATYDDVFARSFRSFRELTDRQALDVQPDRLEIFTTPSATSLADLIAARSAPTVEPSIIAIINASRLDAEVPPNTLVKLVQSGRR